jgi:adenine-specific DNA-methyltransferase
MGNKLDIAPDVAALVAAVNPGKPFLDVFCGMCSVGGAIQDGRPVWGNDVQRAAALAAHCLLAQPQLPPAAATMASMLQSAFDRNRDRLNDRFALQLDEEVAVLRDPTTARYKSAAASWPHVGNEAALADEARSLAQSRERVPFRLATLTFAWGYFGLRQAVEIDSLRYAIHRARANGRISRAEYDWCLLAYLQACSVTASAPGHFAQFLRATSETSLQRVVRQRRRSVWEEFLVALGELKPYGSAEWRESNRVFNRDVRRIWPAVRGAGFAGGLVYADPPYSTDHYSRYYHVLETLLRYDYPLAEGVGRYRPDRFVTPFSLKTKVARAFDRLARGVAGADATLVLSYPSNGLLLKRDPSGLERVLGKHFGRVEAVLRQPSRHSTLGARHGNAHNAVDELVYLARP